MSLLLGGGLMRGIKIPQQEFALKCRGGLCARGGVFAGHYGISQMSNTVRKVMVVTSKDLPVPNRSH